MSERWYVFEWTRYEWTNNPETLGIYVVNEDPQSRSFSSDEGGLPIAHVICEVPTYLRSTDTALEIANQIVADHNSMTDALEGCSDE